MNAVSPFAALIDQVADWQDTFFLRVVEPSMQALGLASYAEDAYGAVYWLAAGLGVLFVTALVLAPAERWRPAEPLPGDEAGRRERRAAIRTDVVYTLVDRLGFVRVLMFFAIDPVLAWARPLLWAEHAPWHLDQSIASWWPGVTDAPLVGFLAYLLLLDFAGYLVHRAQHRFAWWWALHAVHHSQRHMTVWTDSRNHLLDTLVVDAVFATLAQLVGVPPGQFIALVMLTKLAESLAHANLDLSFGRWMGKVFVSPRFHRVHHAMGGARGGREDHDADNCNYGVLFPMWDFACRTARFDLSPGPTGIADQREAAGGRDYGRGFWAQQVLAIRRMVNAST